MWQQNSESTPIAAGHDVQLVISRLFVVPLTKPFEISFATH